LVSWSSEKQKVVSHSSTKVEYRSGVVAPTDIIWITSLIHELRTPTKTPRLYSNNMGAVHLATKPIMHSRLKQLELDLHFVRDFVHAKRLTLLHLPTQFQVADILTKTCIWLFLSQF